MSFRIFLSLALGVACGTVAQAQAPTNPNPESEAVRLLRQTIAEQNRHPDRIIRNLEQELAGTNAPARSGSRKAAAAKPARRPDPVPPTPPTVPPLERQKKIADVESRLDEMVRARQARERSATTNVPAAGPALSKRARLDALLRQVVEGKLSDEQYKKERERILAEPE